MYNYIVLCGGRCEVVEGWSATCHHRPQLAVTPSPCSLVLIVT